MVSEENRAGLFVTIPVYFCFLIGAAYWAYRRMEKMKHTGVNDQITAHFLGGRDFGPLLTAGTLFASSYSGYTVVGVPNEAYRLGWYSLRWIPSTLAILVGYFGTGLRLRKASLLRNHQSPVDFITDRYQSQLLRYMIVFLQVLPTVIYLAAQVIALKGTFNSIFELSPDSTYPVVIIMILILLFEWVGGLNSVAFTDSIQAIVMVLSFIIIPSVIVKNFGGWTDLNPENYPRPDFYQTMTEQEQWSFWQFSLINFSFFTLPHLMQRTYAAKDLKSLRTGYTVMAFGPWFTSFVGVFMGTVGVVMLADDDGNPTSPPNPFAAILEEVMNLGGFARGAGVIAITASLAAIMSTADSLIIAISQLVTVEIVYPLRPSASPTEIAWVGKVVSLVSVVVALLVGIFWDEGITDLGRIQFALSAQAIPSFLFGLFAYNRKTDIHPWCLTIGALCATIYVFAFYFGYTKPQGANALGIDIGVIGLLLQVMVAITLEVLRRMLGGNATEIKSNGENTAETAKLSATQKKEPMSSESDEEGGTIATMEAPLLYADRPSWDVPKLHRFGDHALSPSLLWKSMESTNEPLANPWWVFMLFSALSFCTPMTPANEPPFAPEGSDSIFLWDPAVVNGLPWWAFKSILCSAVPTVLLLVAIRKMQIHFPVDELKIKSEGIDPDLVEMTQEELGRRTSYDEANILVHRRRSSISETMEEPGLTRSQCLSVDPTPPTPSQRKLALLLVTKSSRRVVDMTMDPLGEVADDD